MWVYLKAVHSAQGFDLVCVPWKLLSGELTHPFRWFHVRSRPPSVPVFSRLSQGVTLPGRICEEELCTRFASPKA